MNNMQLSPQKNDFLVAKQLSNSEFSWSIEADQTISYQVQLALNIFSKENLILSRLVGSGNKLPVLVVVDEAVENLYGAQISKYFETHEIHYVMHTIEVSEEAKNFETTMKIVEMLEKNGTLRRSNPFIAIGGGVLLDLAGFAASLFRRGVPHIRIPTNLMGLIDASLGVKTAINLGDRRNRLGTYSAPSTVLLDRSFLSTVPPRDISNGLADILKIGVIKDQKLFDLLEASGQELLGRSMQDDVYAPEVIYRSIQGMLEELAPNLWERDLERCVDFGHTFSPMAEMRALPDLLHGEAVAMDVLLSCIIASQRNLLCQKDVERVGKTMVSMGLDIIHPKFANLETLWDSLEDATRHRDGQQRIPLPSSLGSYVFVNDITFDEVGAAILAQQALADRFQ